MLVPVVVPTPPRELTQIQIAILSFRVTWQAPFPNEMPMFVALAQPLSINPRIHLAGLLLLSALRCYDGIGTEGHHEIVG